MENADLLELRDISKDYGYRSVLSRVGLSAGAGEVIGLLGQSGVGKTTLLNGIAGLGPYDSGDVFLDGERITQLGAVQRRSKRIGHYSGEAAVGKTNLWFFRSQLPRSVLKSHLRSINPFPSLGRRLSEQEARDKADEMLHKFGLAQVAETPVQKLAGGERRRFELARCVAHEPRLILLDEPFAGMDPFTCKAIQSMIRELQREEVTIIITDQHYEHVLEVATRALVLWKGSIAASGTPSEILKNKLAQCCFFDNDGLIAHYSQKQIQEPGAASVFEIRSLVKNYGNRRAVDGLNLEVRKGEIVGLLGPNGAGKTSTFRSAVGFTSKTQGDVISFGRCVDRLRPWHLPSEKIGYVGQDLYVISDLTIDDHFKLACSAKRSMQRSVEKLLETFGLAHIRRVRAGNLSGGERRRLAIAIQVVKQPRLLILDEPFTGIDPVTIHQIQNLIYELRDNGLSVLLSDHREKETLSITNRSYIISRGQVIVSGDVETVLSSEKAQLHYFGKRFDALSFVEQLSQIRQRYEKD